MLNSVLAAWIRPIILSSGFQSSRPMDGINYLLWQLANHSLADSIMRGETAL